MRRKQPAAIKPVSEARSELDRSLELMRMEQVNNDRAWVRLERATAGLMQSLVSEASKAMRGEDVGWRALASGARTSDNTRDYTHAELLDIRRNCRQVWRHDGAVSNAERLLLVGSVGKGLQKPNATKSKAVQKIVDALWEDDDNQRALFGMQALERINLGFMLDGELILALHTSAADHTVKLSVIDPDEITEVIPHPENRNRPMVYQRVCYPQVFDFDAGTWKASSEPSVVYYRDIGIADPFDEYSGGMDASEYLADVPNLQSDVCLIHVPVNTVGVRGVPLVARAVEWVQAYHGCITDLVNLAKALSAIAWYKKVKSRNQTAIDASAAQMSSLTPGAGGAYVANDSVDLSPVSVSTGGVGNLNTAMREIYLVVLRCFGFGEHWYCEANTGNLATAQAMELPALWMLTRWQNLYRSIIDKVISFAVTRAVAFGKASKSEAKHGVDVDFPAPEPRDSGSLPNLLLALDQCASTGVILPYEAAWQAYSALGTTNPTSLMEIQFPDGIQKPPPPSPDDVANMVPQDGGDANA